MSEPKRRKWAVLACCLVAGTIALAGCRSEERNRILQFEEGTYLGKPDQELSDEKIDELRHRARMQQG